MWTAIRRRLAGIIDRSQARSAYYAGDRTAGRLLDQLTTLDDPKLRARVLWELAEVETAMARTHRAGFGPDPIEHEGGRDLADSIASSALLYRLIADVEKAAAHGERRRYTETELEPHAGPVLDRMAGTADAEARGALLDDLYDAVVDVVGGQAAEAVHCLPAPGHRRARTLRQIIAERRGAGATPDVVPDSPTAEDGHHG